MECSVIRRIHVKEHLCSFCWNIYLLKMIVFDLVIISLTFFFVEILVSHSIIYTRLNYILSFLFFWQTRIKCDLCSNIAHAQYHLTMSDATIRNFCSYNCVMVFQTQYNKTPLTLNEQNKSVLSVPIGEFLLWVLDYRLERYLSDFSFFSQYCIAKIC